MSRSSASRARSAWQRWLTIAVWVLVLGLLGWVLSRVPVANIWRVLQRLTLPQIGALLAGNVLILLLFSGRWWVVLRALGHRLPYGALTMHRLAGYGISYFTPGPQFGGEPVQMLLVQKRHRVPTAAAAASVGLDRLLEVIVNLSLLMAGLVVTLQAGWLDGSLGIGIVGLVGLLFMLPLGYLLLIRQGQTPLTRALDGLPGWLHGRNSFVKTREIVSQGEVQARVLFRHKPGIVLAALGASLASWAGMIGEFWLMLTFIGMPITLVQLISIVTAARVAYLLPLPGGLGTLAAGQLLIYQTMGLDPAVGLSASLLIHARDIIFGLVGLWWAGAHWYTGTRRKRMDHLSVRRMESARIPTADGEFELILYGDGQDDKEHLALVLGDLAANQPVLARVHSECFTGDVLGSLRCDCGGQLSEAMQMVATDGAGVIVYLRQEGRGIGLLDKLRAYNLQDEGYDTVDANLILGHAPDERDYTVAGRIFRDLGVDRLRLMTNNPEKVDALKAQGIEVVTRVPLQIDAHPDNAQYLLTKASRMRHLLDVREVRSKTLRPNNGSRKYG